MARYTGPAFKIARRLGFSTLETEKEFSKGKKRTYAPGQHGQARRKMSTYGTQLAEKQKLRFIYGVNEKQFRRTFNKAKKVEGGILGHNFMVLLEQRLDNVVYRMNLATTRRASRQLVNHGHILVNGRKVDIPSYTVLPGDVISVKEASRTMKPMLEALASANSTKEFVSFDEKKFEGTFTRLPERKELNQDIHEEMIVEWYNRMG